MDATQEKPMSHEEWVASIQKEAATDAKSCRCPVRPWATPGSFASGSASESRAVGAWTAKHGNHPYAKTRDELAGALQHAEGRAGSGAAVLDMVADIYGLQRRSEMAAEIRRIAAWSEEPGRGGLDVARKLESIAAQLEAQ